MKPWEPRKAEAMSLESRSTEGCVLGLQGVFPRNMLHQLAGWTLAGKLSGFWERTCVIRRATSSSAEGNSGCETMLSCAGAAAVAAPEAAEGASACVSDTTAQHLIHVCAKLIRPLQLKKYLLYLRKESDRGNPRSTIMQRIQKIHTH